jgi:hypothetical protein
MAGARKDAPERSGVLNRGVIAASFLFKRWAFQTLGILFCRGEFLAGLFILAFSIGIFERITGAIAQGTVSSTFGISVLVWVACWIALSPLVRQKAEPVTRSDVIVGFAGAAAVLVPSAPASHGPDHPEVGSDPPQQPRPIAPGHEPPRGGRAFDAARARDL